MGVTTVPEERFRQIIQGDALGTVSELQFRDLDHFCAGELHNHVGQWEEIVGTVPSPQQTQVLHWIRPKVSVEDFFRPFWGTFKEVFYNSAYPPSVAFRNNPSCRPFADFVRKTLLDRIYSGTVSVLGRVSQIPQPHLELPLTVEPTKPRLCHDARFLNLWMIDVPFKLDSIVHLSRYVSRESYQTVLDDKLGYDHCLLTDAGQNYFGIRWGGWYFVNNTLPFGFLNLWMVDVPFKLDSIVHLSRYVSRESYQTVLDDKLGYDHCLLTDAGQNYFGIRWGGWYFVNNTLPFGWKISPLIYHSTGLVTTNFLHSMGVH